MRPPGNEICPACAERCAVRWVSSTDMPPSWSTSGTSTAAGRKARLERGPHQDIGCRCAVGSGFDAQWAVRTGSHNLVEIGAEDQPLVAALALHVERDRDEWRVLDRDAAALGRGHQPIAAVSLAAQHGGEQLDQGAAVDRRAPIIPCAGARAPHVELPEFGQGAMTGPAP